MASESPDFDGWKANLQRREDEYCTHALPVLCMEMRFPSSVPSVYMSNVRAAMHPEESGHAWLHANPLITSGPRYADAVKRYVNT